MSSSLIILRAVRHPSLEALAVSKVKTSIAINTAKRTLTAHLKTIVNREITNGI